MNISTKFSSSIPTSANALIIPYATDKEYKLPKVTPSVRDALKKYVKVTEYAGKLGEVAFVQQFSGKLSWIVLVGIGDTKKVTTQEVSDVFEKAFRTAQKNKAASALFVVTKEMHELLDDETIGKLVSESAYIATYTFTNKAKKNKHVLGSVSIITNNKTSVAGIKSGVTEGSYIGEATSMVRDYGNAPSNKITPKALSDLARKNAKITGQKVTIFGEKQMEKEKMGGTLGVSKGSLEEAQFIILEHMKGPKDQAPVVLVGKGITFDSGGISIKPSAAMDEMKFDMSGGATVLGVMYAIGKMKLPVNVVALVPASENVPSGSSYKPGDVLTYADGTTVEVLNTDAEGRLILGDALLYARKYKPRAIIDLATLTGAMVVALGDAATGYFVNNERLFQSLETSATSVGEPIWRLPLPESYADRVKSKVADIQNISNKPGAGSITAAKFLEHFIKKGTAWAHFDIAATAWNTSETPGLEHGATGVMVKTLVEYLKRQD